MKNKNHISHPALSWTILFLKKFQLACDFHIITIPQQNEIEILQPAVKLPFGKMYKNNLKTLQLMIDW